MRFTPLNLTLENAPWLSAGCLAVFIHAASLFPFNLQAQSDLAKVPTQSIGNQISIPVRDKEGTLLWMIKADKALKRDEQKIEVETVLIHRYIKSEVDWTITTPHCVFLNEQEEGKPSRKIVSDSEIHIANESIDIQGVGFYCLVEASQFNIRNKVQVLIRSDLIEEKNNMSSNSHIPLLAFAATAAILPISDAQTAAVSPPPTPTPKPAAISPAPSSSGMPKPFTSITSEHLNYDYEKGVATFEGNVVAIDPQLSLKCEMMKVYFAEKNKKVARVEATGKVLMLHEGQEGTGEKAVYTKETGIIVLSGGTPKLKDKGGNWLMSRGIGIIYDVNKKNMTVDKPTLEFQKEGDGNNPLGK